MGRSVSYPSGATVAFRTLETEHEDDWYWGADAYHPRSGRARRWLSQVAIQFEATFGELSMIGRFSNGEAVFERASVQMTK